MNFSNTKFEQIGTSDIAVRCILQLQEFFGGRRRVFDLPLIADGTDFQKAVWEAAAHIPYGETRSYADIARSIGRPLAARAVGQALNKNPICIIIPCHRVVASSGAIGGFAWGAASKQSLLELERQSSTPLATAR